MLLKRFLKNSRKPLGYLIILRRLQEICNHQ